VCTNLLVIGASARAFAASAARLGIKVNGIDLFGDQDLREVCGRVVQIHADDYPDGLPAIAATFPESPVVYTGGLENHLKVLDALSSTRRILGNVAKVVERVRDPAFVQEVARENGCSYPETFFSSAGLPKDGTYLKKPVLSVGGGGIEPWKGSRKKPCMSGELWQEFITGTPMSLSFCVNPKGIEVFSVCRQLIGRGWCRAKDFSFCGAVELLNSGLHQDMFARLLQFANALVEKSGITGLIGVDFIMPRKTAGNPQRKPIILEINPRPTATMELAERRTGRSYAGLHLLSQGFSLPTASMVSTYERDVCWGKAIVFANKPLCISSVFTSHLATCASFMEDQSFGWPVVADLPRRGTVIRAGHPIVTIFASARSPRHVLRRLREHVGGIVQGL
jgi:predicted ATP-grasp superfamily ATP-dependent carboligase